MELRFWHFNMKEACLVELKSSKRKFGETFRDLGQSIEDLYRRAYHDSTETVQENTIKTFIVACSESEEVYALSGAKCMSVLNLSMAYHEMSMNPADKDKTTFSTFRGGSYQYVTMTFESCNAGATFQIIVETAMRVLQPGRTLQWIHQLGVYRPGSKHGNVDALSIKVVDNKEFCKPCNIPWDYVYNNSKHISDWNTNRCDTSDSIIIIDQPCKSQNSQIISAINENGKEELNSEDFWNRKIPKSNGPIANKENGVKKI
ncbi:unnamed protein product [Mytilus coruscus]|uniref:Uncharacterized protein n=1 Tax=Mytilus coruscus TaxID=42192 RepID=A0A6J8B9Q0_MYTCO|nr:unnamed protein product [Mytilus coruscus]